MFKVHSFGNAFVTAFEKKKRETRKNSHIDKRI